MCLSPRLMSHNHYTGKSDDSARKPRITNYASAGLLGIQSPYEFHAYFFSLTQPFMSEILDI